MLNKTVEAYRKLCIVRKHTEIVHLSNKDHANIISVTLYLKRMSFIIDGCNLNILKYTPITLLIKMLK